MKICYQDKKFQQATLTVIIQADAIVDEYMAQGFNLTLRQLYYQFVARGWLDNTERNYDRLGNIVSNARLAGYIDWNAIEDRTREPVVNPHWDTPEEILESAAASYAIDVRNDQPYHIEVWIEKDALIDVVNRVCKNLDVVRFSCRGYVSQSAMWRASQRLDEQTQDRKAVILHLGDHDPSGMDMTRDIDDRLNYTFGSRVEVHRIALTMDQVREVNPPPNPTKLTDSRAAGYIAEFGYESWELDALDPRYLIDLIQTHIDDLTDFDLLSARQDQQTEERRKLRALIDMLDEV